MYTPLMASQNEPVPKSVVKSQMTTDVPGLNGVLNNFLTSQADAFLLQRERVIKGIQDVINPILAEVKAMDVKFDFEPLNAQTFYNVTSPNRYEVIVCFNGMNTEEISIEDGHFPGYAMARLTGKKMISQWKFCSGNSNPSKVYISATIVTKKLLGYMIQALRKTSLQRQGNYSTEVNETLNNSNAVTLQVNGVSHEPCLVDLVPAIPFPGRWVLSAHAWETKPSYWPSRRVKADVVKSGIHLIAKPSSTRSSYQWQIAFLSPTRKLLELDPGCRTKCLLILEMLLENIQSHEGGISGIHLKSLALNMTERFPTKSFWSEDKFATRFTDTLQELQQCLEQTHLQHVFLPGVNMLRDVYKLTLQKCKNEVTKILEDPEKFLSEFNLFELTTSL